ncbi:MAG: hypothetical protein JKY09_07330 [Crocinitomicaceae bacterium]|nr:hypothetical protein [Crocinitomicaceae bacterium]
MREELHGPKVENVGVAVVQHITDENVKVYDVYLLNLRDDIMEGIIITCKGYGVNVNSGEKVETSMLRHRIEVLLPNEAAKIEPIMEEMFGLANEYWVSFWVDNVMYDKKFVFVPEAISEANMKKIPILGDKGVLII